MQFPEALIEAAGCTIVPSPVRFMHGKNPQGQKTMIVNTTGVGTLIGDLNLYILIGKLYSFWWSV